MSNRAPDGGTRPTGRTPAEIDVVWGVGEATTSLGSFDRALSDANLHNYNLVTLSSIVPPGATVVERGQFEPERWPVGEVVGVVLAENTSTDPDERIAAGLGWTTAEEGGVFMEHTCGTREECEHELERTLADAMRTRDWQWMADPETRIVETTVEDVASVVACAIYRPLAWK